MRVVFDTVVFVRSLINPYSRWGQLLFERSDAFELVVSPAILTEYLDVLQRPEITRKFRQVTTRSPQAVLDRLAQATVVHPTDVPAVSRDPNDDIFFATAKLGSATYNVSGDKDVLDVSEYEGVKVITAEEFLRILDSQ
jgi:putative PIN family toxin of toxin-antitoxin system